MKEGIVMTTRRVEVERVSLISSKPFEAVLTVLKAAVGHSDMAEFPNAMKSALTFAQLEDVVRRELGDTGAHDVHRIRSGFDST